MNQNFSKAYIADVDIAPYLILSVGSVDGNATLAPTSTSKLIGVSENVPVAATEVVDAIQGGPGLVQLGGTVAAGDYLTANTDGSGTAITATPGTGLTVNVIGKASVSGVAGDVIPYTTAFSQLHG